jgi:hypothetical protein
MVAHLGHRLAVSELAATSAATGHGTQSFPNDRVLRIRNGPMSSYHNPRSPPAPIRPGVRDLMPSKSPSEAVLESTVIVGSRLGPVFQLAVPANNLFWKRQAGSEPLTR